MSVTAVRMIVIVVCIAGVAGMIVSSALSRNGAALTFGLITAVAILCLMVASAVSTAVSAPTTTDTEAEAARLEQDIAALVASGADEATVRQLVRNALRMGRGRSKHP